MLYKMNLEDILITIKSWNSEANNFRNDGWVQEHYRSNILKVASLLESLDNKCEKNDDDLDEAYKVLNDF